MTKKTKIILAVFLCFEIIMLVIQIISLSSNYWTSWDFRYNMTLFSKDGHRTHRDAVLISRGHAGLWSRCVKVWTSWSKANDTENGSEKCFHNFKDSNGTQIYGFGKLCKIVTAAICILQVVLNLIIVCVVLLISFYKKVPPWLSRVRLPLFKVQGIVSTTAPLLYVIGNMAELVDHVTLAYGLFLIVKMQVWYVHDWGYWIQVSIVYFWISSIFMYTYLSRTNGWKIFQATSRNGESTEVKEVTELRPLRTQEETKEN